MLLKWFDAREASQFGISMAEFFAERVPPDAIPASGYKQLKKASDVISKLYKQAASFRLSHQMNLYKRAKLGNAFQWRLFELGYDKKIIEELTRDILRCL